MFTGLTASDLLDCLTALPEVELVGVTLLRQGRPTPGTWFPTAVPPDTLVNATVQLIGYMDDCQHTAHSLSTLRAIPLTMPMLEYGL